MRNAITTLILCLGRYAVIPLVALSLAAFMTWFVALDRYPMIALTMLPLALPCATTAIVLSLGLLLPIRRPRRDVAVDEGAAPGLWAIWNEFDRTTRRSNRVLLIDAELNASMSEHRRYFGLMRRQLTMTVGLPLLIVLDEHAVRAVLAHEVAHARLQHTSGAANLHEFIVAVRNLFDYFDPDRTITGRIAYTILHSLLTWILMEYRSLSRKNELDADLESAERVGAQDAARALVLFYAYGARMKDLVIAPLEKALVGAIRAPTPPLQRLINQLDAVRALERIEEADLMAEEETDSEHPPLRARLANLGWADIPKVEAAKGSAAEALLSTSTMKDLLERFDGDWQSRVNQIVGIY